MSESVEGRSGALEELTVAECRELLAGGGVGRVAFTTPSGPRIVPVNYLMDDGAIVIRTSPYASLSGRGITVVAFEIDDLDPTLQRGWSVVVVGQLGPVDDPDEAIRLRGSGQLEPWAPGPRNLFLRITPHEITGRRIR